MALYIKDGKLHNQLTAAEITLEGDASIDTLDLSNYAIIAINFPQFVDGRGYSLARLLRERYRYQGELRAVGNVLYDQLNFLLRCGFNAFEIEDNEVQRVGGSEVIMKSFSEITLAYQSATNEITNIRHLRKFI